MRHADDAGLNEAVNEAILRLVKKSRLQSLSIIANAPATEAFCRQLPSALREAKVEPVIFLHFNIVESAPLTDFLKPIVNSDGEFAGKWRVIQHCLTGRLGPAALETELQAQHRQLKQFGLTVAGVDSHQHMHALAPVAEAVNRFVAQHNMITRSYGNMRCITLVGVVKFQMFKLLARLTQLRHHSFPNLPRSWRRTDEPEFVVASWEKLRPQFLKTDMLVVYHPGSDYDHGLKF